MAIYYVDSSITDTNVASGTPDFTTYNPVTFATDTGTDSVYKTIADVKAATFVAGDNILFRRGDTWAEDWDIAMGGVSGNVITIGSYGTGDLPKLQYLHQWGNGEYFLTIENIEFLGSAGAGNIIQIYGGHDITIQNCKIDTNGVDLSTLLNISSSITNRIVYNINVINCIGDGGGVTSGFNVAGDNSGAHDILFENNTITNCTEIGLQAYATSSDVYNITFRRNTVSNTSLLNGAAHGINVGWTIRDVIVERNYCFDNAGFGIVMDAGVHDVVVKNNLCVNNGNNIGGQGDTYGEIYHIKFYNNTLVYGAGTTYAGLFLNIAQGGHDITFKNNIIVSNDSRQEIMDNHDNFTNIVSDYNCFQEKLDPNGARFRYNNTNIYLAAWQAVGQDLHSIALDPQLAADYTLKSNSPCIDAGVDVGVTSDYAGITRPQRNACDIGAYEAIKSNLDIVRVKKSNLKRNFFNNSFFNV